MARGQYTQVSTTEQEDSQEHEAEQSFASHPQTQSSGNSSRATIGASRVEQLEQWGSESGGVVTSFVNDDDLYYQRQELEEEEEEGAALVLRTESVTSSSCDEELARMIEQDNLAMQAEAERGGGSWREEEKEKKETMVLETMELREDMVDGEEVSNAPFQWDVSSVAIIFLGVSMNFGFAIMAASIQSYWHVLAPGKDNLYGFFFGCYEIGPFVLTPLMGYLADLVGIKLLCVISLIASIAGNTLYSLAYILATGIDGNDIDNALGWQVLIGGRLLAGFGATSCAVGVIYLAKVTTYHNRAGVIGVYRSTQVMARTMGPLLMLPTVKMDLTINTTEEKLLNFYTLPGWTAVIFATVTLVLILMMKEPREVDAATGNEMTESQVHQPFRYSKARGLVKDTVYLSTLHFIISSATFAVFSQMFDFAVAQFHMIDNASELWKIYLSFGLGIIPAASCLVLTKNRQYRVTDYEFILLGLAALVISFLFLASWESVPPQSLYFIGTGAMGISEIWYSSMSESFWTKKCSQKRAEAADKFGLFIVTMNCCGALGKFVGPAIGGLVLDVQRVTLESIGIVVNEKWAYSDDATEYFQHLDDPKLYPQVTEACDLRYPQHFFQRGCDVENVNIFLATMGSIIFASGIFMGFYYFPRNMIPRDESTVEDRNGKHHRSYISLLYSSSMSKLHPLLPNASASSLEE
eukprot:Nk52_evm18s211 gene=Nk52_evmTU18s211